MQGQCRILIELQCAFPHVYHIPRQYLCTGDNENWHTALWLHECFGHLAPHGMDHIIWEINRLTVCAAMWGVIGESA
jgi:hypothetical protein